MNIKIILNRVISPIALIVGLIFLIFNFDKIINTDHQSFVYLILVILFHSTYLFILNLRAFFILKAKVIKNINFFEWSDTFFKSILVQDTLISQSGFLFRSVFLRSLNVKYSDLTTFFYFGLLTHVLINLILVLFEINFIYKSGVAFIFLQLLFLTIVCFTIYFIPLLFFFIKKNLFKNLFFHKFDKYFLNLIYNQKKYFLDFNFILKVFFITLITHALELSVFFCAFEFFKSGHNILYIVILFGIGTITDRIPIVSSIPFVRESIFGLFSLNFGINFFDAFLIKLLTTLASILGSMINMSWSLFFKINVK